MPSENLIGVDDFKQQARTQPELESRMTQMQEGEDDVDIASFVRSCLVFSKDQ
jgi:hypothetical protein